MTENMSRWTTEELLDEVIQRSASDGPALQLLEAVVIRARLAEGDRRLWGGTQPELAAAPEFAGVGGTTEMAFASGDSVLIGSSTHEVDPETLSAHAHDHSHRRVANSKLAAHTHNHLHLDDVKADGQLNGHTHGRAHAKLPWEDRDTD